MLDFGFYNMDCMEGMKNFPDKYFDLAIVDPPYGIGEDWKKRNGRNNYAETTYKNSKIPDEIYFRELERVSKNQIIWGYNYYTDILGPTNHLIIWDKQSSNNQVFKYSKAEIAYTSYRIPCNLVSIPWDGYRMGSETGIKKIHPHQKPIALYKWILENYAEKAFKILDTHVGSASSLIACHDMGFQYVGFEIDMTYYELAKKRLEKAKAQQNIFEYLD